MTRRDLEFFDRIIKQIKSLIDLKEEIGKNFNTLNEKSSPEEMFKVFQMIVEYDKKGILYHALCDIQDEIDKLISDLEQELKAL